MNRPLRKNKIRAYSSKKKFISGVGLAFIGLTILFLGYKHLFKLEVGASIYGSLENSLEVTGVIIRKEITFCAPIGGSIELIKENGSSVQAGDVVAVINNSNLKEAAIDQFEQQNQLKTKKIENFHDEIYVNNRNMALINKEINEQLNQLNLLINQGKLEEISSVKKSLDQLVLKRYDLSNENRVLSEQIAKEEQNLGSDKEELTKFLERSEWEIRASSAGIVSWSVDGWEEKLTPYGFENLKGEVLKTIDVVKVKTETVNNAQVQANQKIGKIIDGSSLYVAAAISNKEAKLFYPGKEIGINFIGHSDLKDCMGEVVALNKDETETLLIVKVECPVFLLADQRVVPVKFILEKCSGIIVPHTSIYKYLNQDGLVVQKDDDYIWVPVKILFTKDSQVVIEGIKADEYYVLNPERIKNKIAYPQG